MKILVRRIALLTAATAAVVGMNMVSATPASAMDSGWGCGGACRVR